MMDRSPAYRGMQVEGILEADDLRLHEASASAAFGQGGLAFAFMDTHLCFGYFQ